MNLDQQIQVLISNAPQDGQTPKLIAAIAPGLKLLAQQLRHSQYYILQTVNQDWILTILSNRDNASEKRVVYAFPTAQDAKTESASLQDSQVMPLPVLVTHILFQMVAMQTIDSVVFFEVPENRGTGIEVRREDVQNLIQSQLKQYQSVPRQPSRKIPDNIA